MIFVMITLFLSTVFYYIGGREMVRIKKNEEPEEKEEREAYQSQFVKQSLMIETGIVDPGQMSNVIGVAVYNKVSFMRQSKAYQSVMKQSKVENIPYASIHGSPRNGKTRSVYQA